ncbi:hypothetical protein V6Z11_A09G271500 [Gossypium hirsutum]
MNQPNSPIEYRLFLKLGLPFFEGTLELLYIFPCPKAELTESPNKLGFLLTIPIPERLPAQGPDEVQLFPKMSPTVEVGPDNLEWLHSGRVGGSRLVGLPSGL